jgi:hypothetical protein
MFWVPADPAPGNDLYVILSNFDTAGGFAELWAGIGYSVCADTDQLVHIICLSNNFHGGGTQVDAFPTSDAQIYQTKQQLGLQFIIDIEAAGVSAENNDVSFAVTFAWITGPKE